VDDVLKIALCGKMRSGKDSVGALLTTRYDFYPKIAFGDTLKEIAHKTFPHIPREPKPRALYQHMNGHRAFYENVWVDPVARKVGYALDMRSTKGIVITDVRQQNEFDWCRANGFTIVRVTASDDVRIARAQRSKDVFDYEDLTHPTELEIDTFDVDYELTNDGAYPDLVAEVERLISTLQSDKAKGAI